MPPRRRQPSGSSLSQRESTERSRPNNRNQPNNNNNEEQEAEEEEEDENDEDDVSERALTSPVGAPSGRPSRPSQKQQLTHGSMNGWGFASSSRPQSPSILVGWQNLSIPNPNSPPSTLTSFKSHCAKQKPSIIRSGIPAFLRTNVWAVLCQSYLNITRLESHVRYYSITVASSRRCVSERSQRDIRKDVSRTMQNHPKFQSKLGQKQIERILLAFAVRAPLIGYCQSMSHVCAWLLLVYDEEQSFWTICTLVDTILPADYYSPSLLGSRTDTDVFTHLLSKKMPKLYTHTQNIGCDLSMLGLKWFLCLFTLTLPMESAARVWDVVLMEGSHVLLNFALALIELNREKLMRCHDVSSMLSVMSSIGSDMDDADLLIRTAFKSPCDVSEKDINRLRSERRQSLLIEYQTQLHARLAKKFVDENKRQTVRNERRIRLEQEEEALAAGTTVIKLGRQGKPHETKIYLIKHIPPKNKSAVAITSSLMAADSNNNIDPDDQFEPFEEEELDEEDHLDVSNHRPKPSNELNKPTWSVRWDSSKKKKPLSDCIIALKSAIITIGPTTGLFLKQNKNITNEYQTTKEKLCMSFVTNQRSLDVIFMESKDIDLWKAVLARTDCLSYHDIPGDRDAAAEKQRRRERDRIRQSEWEREQRQSRRQKGELSDGEKEDDDEENGDLNKPRTRYDDDDADDNRDGDEDKQYDDRSPRGGSGSGGDDVKEISPARDKLPRLPNSEVTKRSVTAPLTIAPTTVSTASSSRRRGEDDPNPKKIARSDSAEHLRLEDL